MARNVINLLLILTIVVAAVAVLSGYTRFNGFYICDDSKDACAAHQSTTIAATATAMQEQYLQKRIDYHRRLSHRPDYIEFALDPTGLILGRENLLAFDADTEHLRLLIDSDFVYLQNISGASAIPVRFDGVKAYPRQHVLADQDQILIGEATITYQKGLSGVNYLVTQQAGQQLAYRIEGSEVTGVSQLQHNASDDLAALHWQAVGYCEDSWFGYYKAKIKKVFRKQDSQIKLGGHRICAGHLPLLNVPQASFTLLDNGVFKASSRMPNIYNRYSVMIKPKEGSAFMLKDNYLRLPLDVLTKGSLWLKLGYSEYSVTLQGEKLRFEVLGNAIKFSPGGITASDKGQVNAKPLVSSGWLGMLFFFILLAGYYFIARPRTIVALNQLLTLNIKVFGANAQALPAKWFYAIANWVWGGLSVLFGVPWRLFRAYILEVVFWLAFFAIQFVVLSNNASAIAISCALTMMALVTVTARSKSLEVLLVTFFACLLLLNGIDYGLSLNVSPQMLADEQLSEVNWYSMNKYFNDFTWQLLLINSGLQLWLILLPLRSPMYQYDDSVDGQHWQKSFNFAFVWLVLLLVQLLAGSETGILGLVQPNEGVKLLLCLLAAFIIFPAVKTAFYDIERYIRRDGELTFAEAAGYSLSLLKLPFWYLLISILAMGALAFAIDDLSYLVIIAVCALATGLYLFLLLCRALFWIIVASRPQWRRWSEASASSMHRMGTLIRATNTILFPVAVLVFSYLTLAALFPGLASIQFDAFQNYVDRISAWQMPFAHQQSAYQLAQAFQLREAPFAAIELYKVPEVDDDFALSGWMVSYTRFPKFLLFFAFFGLIFSLAYMAFTAVARQRLLPEGVAKCSLEGGVFAGIGILLGHMLLAVSTNYNLLPVMGQPFPLLGRQGSFIMLFAIPFFIFVSVLFPAGNGGDDE